MLRFRTFGLVIVGALLTQTVASASVALQNVQVYRWGYVDFNDQRVAGSDFSTWGGLNYSEQRAFASNDLDYKIGQQGSSQGLAKMSSEGILHGEWEPTNETGSVLGQTSVSTRFTVNETLRAELDGKIWSRYVNPNDNEVIVPGTYWTRARLMDAVTGALVYSRITRCDSTEGWINIKSTSVDTTLTLEPGRYNLVLDSYFDTTLTSPLTETQRVSMGYEGNPSKAWDIDLEVRRFSLWELGTVPEPASASLLAATLLGVMVRRRR